MRVLRSVRHFVERDLSGGSTFKKILLDSDRGMRGVSIPPMVSGMIV